MYKLVPLIFVAIVSFSSCAPRGESKTLSEIFEIQQNAFNTALTKSVNVPGEVKELAKILPMQIDEFNPSKVINSIDKLIGKAGYTVRPAMTELRNQYKHLESNKKVNSAAVKLLVARTYSIFAEELNTTSFRLS